MWQALQELAVAVLIFLGVFSGGSTSSNDSQQPAIFASSTILVTYVIDGDTLEIVGGERVRLLGIDTPERNECYYEEARTFLKNAVVGREVRLESDRTNRDEYGRLLRHVFYSNEGREQHLNYELIERGYAVVLPIPPDRAYREEFKAAETAAKAAVVGRYRACN